MALFAHAQTDSAIQASAFAEAPGKVSANNVLSFTADNLGNVYVLTTTGLLKKFNSKGDSLNVFNDVRRYGAVYSMDVTNPLKMLLYYKSFSTAVMLDRFLNRINTIDFRKTDIFQAKAIAPSYDNNVWVFDEQSAKLKKIGDDGKLISETIDLRQVLDVLPSPDKIIDRDGYVYLYDENKGMYIFDYYGVFKNALPITGIKDVQVINKTILGRKENKFVKYTLGTLDLQEAVLPPLIEKAQNICIMQHGIYVQDSTGIAMYMYR
ncbi:MAG: hypothetical protein QM802_14525 [Agriterribacter sp.]